ncbi:MAG TPA: FAD-binding oxidoreductase [Actinophytocola sp.]|uniref:FAD-binding oxidoreductase n=1 Tax=Actinophytocola sp. TaxID=1872138 RepID=UPI002DB6F6EE|nr:FAD-binding oxidoreductase [Actinophytocola sp.]HEU5471563.1 FAD-binding oxidoreductase [Actinophytocola sp.]
MTGTASGCTGAPPPGTSQASSAPPVSSAPPSPPDWAALRARLSGGLVLSGEPGYDAARRPFNLIFDTRAPAAVATCTRAEDVQACVDVARAARIPIAARSGGHSYAGYCVPDGGLVADLGRMSGVEVRPDGTAVIGAGTRLIDVYAGLAAAGRCLPAGSGPGVGIAGLTLGGGIGVLSRKFGLTCDRLVSARVVTADGQLRTAAADNEPDLFWALRGGGGGNFGIVTSFGFATEPAPDLTVFSLNFPAGAGADVVDAWQRWVPGTPDELWSMCRLSAGSPPSCRVTGCFVGPPAALTGLLAGLAVRPSARSVQGKDFLAAMRWFAGCAQRSVAECHPAPEGGQLDRTGFVAASRMLPAAVDAGRLVSVLEGRRGVDLLLDSFGGAISRVDSAATAFPHRAALASAQVYAGATARTLQAVTASVAQVRDAIGELSGNTGYVNYIDPGLVDWQNAYYGANLPRLRAVARRYDPAAVFGFAQGISAG